jgi:SAM-dependent methyltransferase
LKTDTTLTTTMSPDNLYQTVTPPITSNAINWVSGGIILTLNKFRHSIQGYTTPRTFSIDDIYKAVNYDYSVIALWNHFLKEYCGADYSVSGKRILELGPGADLGIGLILLAMGAKKYNSLDINNLVDTVPDQFYTSLFDIIDKQHNSVVPRQELESQLEATTSGNNHELNYICDPTFDMSRFREENIDLVLSNAAFEHFDDIPNTFAQLSSIVRPGGILLAEVDLSTHTRWIRDRDPLNIYRYSSLYYRMTKFSGTPNRFRPSQYTSLLKENGWSDIRVIPYRTLDTDYVSNVQPKLAKRFRDAECSMEALSIILCARR